MVPGACKTITLAENVADDMPADIGQAEITAGIAVGEFFVIKSQEMEHGGVQIVDVHRVFDRAKPKLVRRAVDLASLDSAAGR